ncbi:hypothetical protein PTSG_09040 [Salpingoeca rosetta]|uniref:Vacuolar fusion protein MON1 homolog n=1 Tax=Salpingoeca rosetta (strain ATCC 50818 / BSB-021) TaxID=946362 RepID=F2UM15_SALR5|nr:uncharacterized protein PTSG_09040 [Salpingoeca rosetta]EGD78164.1 hypothetical protein PTSG_09040 [Salpingoeca rosetta]|eukprot:XP_004989840.1 hypothetical protein PTSG_09040 [Salpingoeca rosetta]
MSSSQQEQHLADATELEELERRLTLESEGLDLDGEPGAHVDDDGEGGNGGDGELGGEDEDDNPLELSKPDVVFHMEDSFNQHDDDEDMDDDDAGENDAMTEGDRGEDARASRGNSFRAGEGEGKRSRAGSNVRRAYEELSQGRSPTVRSHASSITSRHDTEEPQRTDAALEEASWVEEDKHIIILSDAGKPIYTRHGSEDMIVTRAGVIQALISFIEENYRRPDGTHGSVPFRQQKEMTEDERDELMWFKAGEFYFVFLVRSPLYLLMVSKTGEAVKHLKQQLEYVYSQLLSITTLSHIQRAFHRWSNYDLRCHLAGMEKFTEHLIDRLQADYAFFLNAYQCLPMDPSVRDKLGALIQQHKQKEVVFALVVGNGKVMSLMRPRRFPLKPQDILLMLNVVQTPTRSFDVGETWMPLCLPHFNSSGFMHAHVTYLHEEEGIFLLLLSNKQDAFKTLSTCRNEIVSSLADSKLLAGVLRAVRAESFRVSTLKIPDLRHFVYKHIKTNQFTVPALEPPYSEPDEERRLFCLYQHVESQMHANNRPVKLFFRSSLQEAVLGWATATFELYAVFDALATKQTVTASVLALLKWIKKSETRLFMTSPQLTS